MEENYFHPLRGQYDVLNDDDYVYIHADINSMYPSIIAAHKVAPAHLDTNAFVILLVGLKIKELKLNTAMKILLTELIEIL